MVLNWNGYWYTVTHANDDVGGCVHVDLQRRAHAETWPERVARITFWDADGQYVISISADELPLAVIEQFAAAAKLIVEPPPD